MKRLYVWVRRADGAVNLGGQLATSDVVSGGRFQAEFEYSAAWASDPTAFALDPISLPVRSPSRRFAAEQFHPPLAIFDDALPDDWGRQLLTRYLKSKGRPPSPPEMLLELRGGGIGALVFTQEQATPDCLASSSTRSLAALLAAASKFERGTLTNDDEFRQLLEGSSRAGGACPKALVHDERGEWLVKFPSPSRDGIHDVVGLEATCLELARAAKLTVPESHLVSVGRRRVLLVRRFDVTARGGRFHMVSFRTLCGERPGLFITEYGELVQVLRRVSASPAADVGALFRHMVFNAAIGNVDDHLKNFWMLADSNVGYRLAPAFDLVPDVTERRDHTLAFRSGFGCPTRKVLLELAAAWDISHARDIVEQVTDSVSAFSKAARRLGVRRPASVGLIAADVHRRLRLMGS